MKNLILNLFFLLTFSALHAQATLQTDTVQVWGNCDMCKKRIETAAFGKGVKKAEWNEITQQLVVVYKTDKTSLEIIEKRIAAAGHDTGHVKADAISYDRLPDCCRYSRQE